MSPFGEENKSIFLLNLEVYRGLNGPQSKSVKAPEPLPGQPENNKVDHGDAAEVPVFAVIRLTTFLLSFFLTLNRKMKSKPVKLNILHLKKSQSSNSK